MRSLSFCLTVLFILSAIVRPLSAEEEPPEISDPYLTNWQLGGDYMEQGRWEDAIDAYQRHIEELPKAVAARIYMGNAYEELGQKEKAYQLYRDAASIYPDIAMTYLRSEPGPNPVIADLLCDFGIQHAEVGDAFEAFGFFADAVSVYPDHVEAHFRLGAALLELGEKEYAIDEYGTLKRLDGEKAAELQLLIAESLSQ